ELMTDPLAHLRRVEPVEHRLEATLEGPVGQERAERRARRRVGVDVGHDVEASARAASMSARASATLPQLGRPAALMWLTWTDSSPSRPTRIASPTASRSVAPSPRMWLA